MRSGIYGLTDESRQAVCYVGRAFDVDRRYRQHIREGRRRLNEVRGRGWFASPIMRSRENWLAYMMHLQKEVGLVLLEPVIQDEVQQASRELAWARQLSSAGVPLANGSSAGAHLGPYLAKGDCPYTCTLPTAAAEQIDPPDGLLRRPYWGKVIPIAGISA